jgi:hypothetical protein
MQKPASRDRKKTASARTTKRKVLDSRGLPILDGYGYPVHRPLLQDKMRFILGELGIDKPAQTKRVREIVEKLAKQSERLAKHKLPEPV